MKGSRIARALVVLLLAVTSFAPWMAVAQTGGAQPDPAAVTPDPWPKVVKQGNATYTLYQPQMDSWDGYNFAAHAAVSVLPAGARAPDFGVIDITANTHVFRLFRVVHFTDIAVVKATFPATPDKAVAYQQGFQTMVAGGPSTMSLDRLQAELSIQNALKMGKAVPVKNDPPSIIFTPRTGVLVLIDGAPAWRSVAGTSLERIINTRSLVLLDDSSGKYYIHMFDGFMVATALTGPWTVAAQFPAGATKLAQELSKQGIVDLMTGPADKKLSLKSVLPDVVVATSPTEIVITDGTPDWAPLDGTMLLYVKNTTGNVFKDLNDQNTYVLVTGRWFRAPGFTGPWQYVAGKDLPPDFFKIPDDSPKENVKASIPGTPQAQEAVIANQIPETATVSRTKATFTPTINGAPDVQPVQDTALSYVVNSPSPIIMVGPYEWYALQAGVWFTASSVQGPWVVATYIPPSIYSIPPSSPIYYATYAQIYDVTPQWVVVGYTPGYMGTIVTGDGVVVYGTGYYYTPYIGATVWYPPPVTYGYAANPTWTPWTGWAIGFGFGWAMGAAWGSSCCWGYACAPYWGAMPYGHYYSAGYVRGPYGGAAAWGPGGWAATTGNVYHQWGATTAVTRTSGGYNAWTGNAWASKVGTSYNSVTGRVSAGQRAEVGNVYTGNYAYGQRGATYNPNTGVTARGGSATYGNAYTGQQGSARGGQVSGPGGQTAGAARVNNNYYADHDGNVYKNTGSGWEKYSDGSWNSVPQTNRETQSLDSAQQARQWGDQRSASSSWGSKSWGGGFGSSGWGGDSSGRFSSGSAGLGSSGGGGWDRGGGSGGGGWDRGGGSFGGGGGWDRGGGSFGGGGRSWGGGSFGGFHGGGGRR
ncbi:MAG TPA: autotransporter [Candidatus Methylomirabilis sp.]|nr:autotransporter [Candidatus Methylomirabilis sp.]